jgi:DNA-binding IclR family transcriptional regulator
MTAHEPNLRRLPIETAIGEIRQAGVATIPSQVVDGVTDLSAPVIEHDHAVCAMTIPFIERRGSSVNMATTRQLLVNAAKEVSHVLAHGQPQSLNG